MIDYAAVTKATRAFKSRLTRLTNTKDYDGIIALWTEFEAYFDTRGWSMPDNWRLWKNAAEDAAYARRRALANTEGSDVN